jgi:hypothetical protein
MAVDSAGKAQVSGSGQTPYLVIPLVKEIPSARAGTPSTYAGPNSFHVCGDSDRAVGNGPIMAS